MDGEPEHLGQMAHRLFAGVILPVGVGDEADRGVEGEIRRHAGETLRIKRQDALQPLQRIERQEADDREGDHRHRIGQPGLLARLVDAGEAIEQAFNRPHDRRKKVGLARVDLDDQAAQRNGGDQREREDDRDLRPADEGHGFPLGREGLEFLGIDERVEQIDGEQQADREADDGFDHRELLKPIAGDGVDAHQREEQHSEDEVDDVRHGGRPLRFDARFVERKPISDQCGKPVRGIREK